MRSVQRRMAETGALPFVWLTVGIGVLNLSMKVADKSERILGVLTTCRAVEGRAWTAFEVGSERAYC